MSRAMLLSELLPDRVLPPQLAGVVISGLGLDSRAIGPGEAFFALAGARGHGLDHAEQALAAGATAIVFEPPAPAGTTVPDRALALPGLRTELGAIADRFHGQPSRAMVVIGVTGTNGKTSTVQLLAQALEGAGHCAASIGTLGVGRPGALCAGERTTPDVLTVHRLLAGLRADSVDHVAMEVSSHALDQGRVDGVRFGIAVFTNLSRDHLDYHGSMVTYGAAKARLFSCAGLAAAVINLDDAFGRSLFAGLAGVKRPIGVSVQGELAASVRAHAVALGPGGLHFDLQIGEHALPVHSPLLGRFNVDNLLAVAGVLHALDWPLAAIAARLASLQPVPGRMQRLGGTDGQPLVVIDYAHTPDALEQALASLRDHARGRMLCLFGCGGERDAGKRPQMAAIAERLADSVVVSDDNPRDEDGDAIVAAIVAGFERPEAVAVERDRALAIGWIIAQASPDDVVLIAGKGHETYQESAGRRLPFDDARQAQQALELRS